MSYLLKRRLEKRLIIILIIIFVLTNIVFLVYKNTVIKYYRYSTPVEAFEKSSFRDNELIDIISDKDIALLIFKDQNGTISNKITAKDDRGWTPLTMKYRDQKSVSNSSGFFYMKEVQGKYVIEIISVSESNSDIPIITDSLNSDFIVNSYNLNSGKTLICGFLVSDSEFPKDYKVLIGGKEIFL